MKTIRLTALLLCAVLLVPTLAACGEAEPAAPAVTTAAGAGESADTTEAETEPPVTTATPDIPDDTDLDGQDFIFCVTEGLNLWNDRLTPDIWTEALDGEPINDAVYQRNSLLSETLNVNIGEYDVAEPVVTVRKSVTAGDPICDALDDGISEMASLVSGGFLADMSRFDYLDFEQPWWNHSLAHDLTVKGHTFLAAGDMIISDNRATWAMAFNKAYIADFNVDDPYELVRGGTWTYDKLYSMASGVSADLDGDGELADWDRWGMISENYNTFALLCGSGARICSIDEDTGRPYLSFFNERNVDALTKVAKIQYDKTVTLRPNMLKTHYENEYFDCLIKSFCEGNSMFWTGSMAIIQWMRSFDCDFGIIPMPKYDDAQEDYHSAFSNSQTTIIALPATNADYETAGIVLEAMACYSYNLLTPAYYDTTLIAKGLRDSDSEEMLDIIFAGTLFDIGAVFAWGSLVDSIGSMSSEKGAETIASKYASYEASVEKAIDKFMDALETNFG